MDVIRMLFGIFIIVMTVITVIKKLALGLKNHREIKESIELLRSSLGEPKEEYHPDQSLYERFQDDVENSYILTAMAYDILNHCRKQPWDISVRTAEKLGPHAAGQYAYGSSGSEIRILIGDHAHDNIVFSVLIHEFMHHFLRTGGISFEDTHKNEVLTDTAALYLGFSGFMNRGYIGVGYLSYRELLYAEKLIKE